MHRKVERLITEQSAACIEDIMETLQAGATRTPWTLIARQRMAVVAIEAVRLYKESINHLVADKPYRISRRN